MPTKAGYGFSRDAGVFKVRGGRVFVVVASDKMIDITDSVVATLNVHREAVGEGWAGEVVTIDLRLVLPGLHVVDPQHEQEPEPVEEPGVNKPRRISLPDVPPPRRLGR